MFNKLTVSAKFLIHLNIFRVFKGRMLREVLRCVAVHLLQSEKKTRQSISILEMSALSDRSYK